MIPLDCPKDSCKADMLASPIMALQICRLLKDILRGLATEDNSISNGKVIIRTVYAIRHAPP